MTGRSKNVHLLISTVIIAIVAFAYGLFPTISLPWLFDFNVESTDLKMVFRATMGLYIGLAGLWIAGIFKPHLWRTATISNVIFMLGLAAGRLISLLIDGIPSEVFLYGFFVELVLGIWGLRNLYQHH
jgi:Domain of unknown function (DUF4345)